MSVDSTTRTVAADALRASAQAVVKARVMPPDLSSTKAAVTQAVALLDASEKTRLARTCARRSIERVTGTKPEVGELEAVLFQLDNNTTDADTLRDKLWNLDQSLIETSTRDEAHVRFVMALGAVTEAVEATFPIPWKEPPEDVEQARTRSTVMAVLGAVLAGPNPYNDVIPAYEAIALLVERRTKIDRVEKEFLKPKAIHVDVIGTGYPPSPRYSYTIWVSQDQTGRWASVIGGPVVHSGPEVKPPSHLHGGDSEDEAVAGAMAAIRKSHPDLTVRVQGARA